VVAAADAVLLVKLI
jgi:hypothetical protein